MGRSTAGRPVGGFEHFYGFIGGETNQWHPALYEDDAGRAATTPEEGYHLTEDLADKAIEWIRQQKALMPDKPFFIYFAPGATHAPHHVPKDWIDRYKGQFDQGWDALRERRSRARRHSASSRRRRADGAHGEIPAWDECRRVKPSLPARWRCTPAFLEYADHHVGA